MNEFELRLEEVGWLFYSSAGNNVIIQALKEIAPGYKNQNAQNQCKYRLLCLDSISRNLKDQPYLANLIYYTYPWIPRLNSHDIYNLKRVKEWQYEAYKTYKLGRQKESEALVEKINTLYPFPKFKLNQIFVALEDHDFHTVLELYEPFNLSQKRVSNPELMGFPFWKGEKEKTILITQRGFGYGDLINFSWLIFEQIAPNNKLVFTINVPIENLLKRSFSEFKLWNGKEPFDCVIDSCLRIFSVLKIDFSQIKAPKNYIKAPTQSNINKDIFNTDKLKIGLCWMSSERYRVDNSETFDFNVLDFAAIPIERCCDIQNFEPLFKLDCQFYSLLPDDLSRKASKQYPFIDLSDELLDFEDTAYVIEQLDLVITVDTAVAHLAGALGKPVWVLLPECCDMRWGETGDTTGWYESMRLFRQTEDGDWKGVIDRVKDDLTKLIASHAVAV